MSCESVAKIWRILQFGGPSRGWVLTSKQEKRFDGNSMFLKISGNLASGLLEKPIWLSGSTSVAHSLRLFDPRGFTSGLQMSKVWNIRSFCSVVCEFPEIRTDFSGDLRLFL